ncbi:MAG: DNA polymerase III subunit alpha, partial [Romboutsia sp.]|nr:DNA polymerase III subunit alpha [Romboutsia sp.]
MDTRRHEVINYTVNKYGADKVAAIITEGREGAKVAIRDVGAVLDLSIKLIDKVAKLIPQAPGMTLDKALTTEIELKELYEKDATVKLLIDKAKMIEGLLRQTGVHAAGVIISDKPLTEYGSLVEVEGSDLPVFVGNMAAVEYFRLLKMDFLGLKTLTVLDDCKNLVKKNYGIEIDLENLDLNDKKVYEFIGTGNTNGAFQLESSGMQDFMMKLKPSSLEDIIIGISMYRPGPMDKIPYLLECKQDTSLIDYPEDAKHLLAPI